MSDFDDLGIVGKLALPTFLTVQALHRGEFGFARYDLANGGRRNVPYAKGVLALGPSCSGSERIFAQTLPPKWAVLSTILTKIWLSVGPFFRSFGHNSLVSRPFSTRKVRNRSSHHVSIRIGQGGGQFDSSFRSGQRSGQTLVKLGQPWSNLVEFGQSSPKLWEMYPGPRFKGFWAWWVLVGLETARSNLGQTSGECVPDPSSWGHLMCRAFVGSGRLRFGLSRFACPTPEKIPGVKMGL
uniref:Uncharacterized protein n=1 Tax=Fagus sylvatica TaxID=28930 RepID=A0A2N9HTR4_FAGSY